MSDSRDDKERKRRLAQMEDATIPVRPEQRGAALPGNTPGVDEEFEPTHAVDRDDTQNRPPRQPQPAEGPAAVPSFDDEVAARKAPAPRPARGFTASLPRPVPLPDSDPDADTLPPSGILGSTPSEVFAGKDSFAAPIPRGPSPQRPVSTKKVSAPGSIPSALKIDDKDFGALDDPTGPSDVEVTPHSPTRIAPEDSFAGIDPRLGGATSVPIVDIPMDSSPSVTPVEIPIEPPEPTAYVEAPTPAHKAQSVEPIDPADPTRAGAPYPASPSAQAASSAEEPSGFTVEIPVVRSTQEGDDPFAPQPAPGPATLLHERPTALVQPQPDATYQKNVPTQTIVADRAARREVTQELPRGATEEIALANDQTRVRPPSRAPIVAMGLLAFVVVASLGVVALWRAGVIRLPGTADAITNTTNTTNTITDTPADTPAVTSNVVDAGSIATLPPPRESPKPDPTPADPTPDPRPPDPTPDPTPPPPPPPAPLAPPAPPPSVVAQPTTSMPTTWVRAPDGFGPFIERAGFPGAGTALGRGVRKAVGDIIPSSKLGVRGEIRRVDVKKTEVLAECTLYVFETTGPRATLRATGRSELEPKAPRDRAVKSAAEACGAALESDLRAAIAHAGK